MSKYRVTAPNPITGNHWGMRFENGVAVTAIDYLAHKLELRGYIVERLDLPSEAPKAAVETDAPQEAGAPSGAVEEAEPVRHGCPTCGKVYETKQGLTRHMKTHQ